MTQISDEFDVPSSETEMTEVLAHLDGIQIPKRKNVSFDDALNETGFGKYNIFLILVCGFILFASITESCGVGYIVPASECELNLNSFTKGILTSTNVIGIMCSCAIWGYLADFKGRRNLLLINLVLAFATGFIASFIPSFWGFCILRLINGICISCPAAVTFVYFGEFLSTTTRGKCMPWGTIFIGIAMTILPVLAWPLLQSSINVEFLGLRLNNWRIYMLMNSTPSILVAFALLKLPESPKFLYHNGKFAEALKVMRTMYSCNTGKPEYTFPVVSLNEKIILESKTVKKSILQELVQQIVPLFKPPLLTYIITSCFMQAITYAVSAGLYLWYPDVTKQISNSGNTGVTICEALSVKHNSEDNGLACNNTVDDNIFILSIIIGTSYIIGYTTWGVVVKLLGTKAFFMVLMGLSGVCMAGLCLLSQKLLIDIAFIGCLALSGIAVTVLNAWIVDIFPTQICGLALCFALTVGRAGSVLSSSAFGMLVEWNCIITFLLYALSLIGCVLLAFIVPQKS